MRSILFTLYLSFSLYNCQCQRLILAAIDTVSFIHFNPSAPGFRDDVICEFKEEIYWVHNAKRPLGMKYDSLVLLKVDKNGKVKIIQNLRTDNKLSVSGMTSLVVNENFLYLVDYLGVYTYEIVNRKYIYKDFNAVGDYFGRDNRSFGLFRLWHSTKRGVFTSDFQETYQTVDGCSPMFIGHIDERNRVIIDSFRHNVCDIYFTNHNAVYPIAVNESGSRYAIGNILSNTISLFDISGRKFEKLSETNISDTSWSLLNSDSINYWWSKVEGKVDKDYIYRRKIGLERANSDYIQNLFFLNDSILFIFFGNRNLNKSGAFVKLFNTNTNKIYNISSDACKSWKDKIPFIGYSIVSSHGMLYVLYPWLDESNVDKAKGKGWLLARIRLDWL